MENNTVFDSLDFLSDVLKDFCQKHSVDLRSADDILHAETKDKNGFNPLSKYQQAWLKQFVEIWKLMIDSMDKERVLEELKKLKSQYHSPSEEVLDAEYKIVRDAEIDSSGDRD